MSNLEFFSLKPLRGDVLTRLAFEDGAGYLLSRAAQFYRLHGSIYSDHEIPASLHSAPVLGVAVLPPTEPRCIFGVGENFTPSDRPLKDRIFTKTLNTIAPSGGRLLLPKDSSHTVFEGELVAVIGKEARHLDVDQAHQAIFGYTIGNDFSEDGWFREDRQWWRVKGVDGYSPLGPSIYVGTPDWSARIVTKVNGHVRQNAPLSEMRTSPANVVSEISRYVTLHPGDLIFLGTPPGAASVKPGDEVTVSIDGIGTLTTTIGRFEKEGP